MHATRADDENRATGQEKIQVIIYDVHTLKAAVTASRFGTSAEKSIMLSGLLPGDEVSHSENPIQESIRTLNGSGY
jgi:hypothetical protein